MGNSRGIDVDAENLEVEGSELEDGLRMVSGVGQLSELGRARATQSVLKNPNPLKDDEAFAVLAVAVLV
ncbi:hypothetical protein VNO80_19792 [Phaseolus coccineus]|uniref:Uncharacterized protein n=1 Tax=Phaseolus coccineus TaxID=3886 RepID=A0AAN9R053_PHACN